MAAAVEFDLEHAAAGIELRILEQIARLGDRRKRNIDTVEDFGKLAKLMAGNDFGHDRAERGARPHAILVGLVSRVVQKIVPVKLRAEALPVPVAGQADKNLFAVGGGERFVNRPGAVACREIRDVCKRFSACPFKETLPCYRCSSTATIAIAKEPHAGSS